MSNPESMTNESAVPRKSNHSIWLPLLAAGLAGVGGFAFFDSSRQSAELQKLHRELAADEQELATVRAGMEKSDRTVSGSLDDLRQQMSSDRKGLAQSISKVKEGTQRNLDSVAKKTAADHAALANELSSVKSTAADTSTKVEGVTTEVASVKNDVASTRSALDAATADLKRVNGDMGVMSGLIATNSKEIQALRDLGDRNIYEFTLMKNGAMQRVGDIQMRLLKSDAKKNRYTVLVLADDRSVEKKDKTTNEPVQFYVSSKAHTPYEVVVNSVARNSVTGYLATPKVTTAAR
jgi:chromosome segregation ATPase